ncbi:hypothetical protein HC928_02840 [bacterium]|nr:hypothetical protein [bacterium]
MSIDAFLHEIEAKFKTGQATEHTYRAALKALFKETIWAMYFVLLCV